MNKTITLSIAIKTPFLTGNAKAPEQSLDGLMLRDANNRLMFPGSLVRGVLRDAIESLAMRCKKSGLAGLSKVTSDSCIYQMFGRKSDAELCMDSAVGSINSSVAASPHAYAPDRPKIVFGDLVSETEYPTRPALSKIRIRRSELTGSAMEGNFQRIELIAPHGTEILFTMLITLGDKADAENIAKMITLAFGAITAIGSAKSAGFGRIATSPKISIGICTEYEAVSLEPTQKSARLQLQINGPLLINTERDGNNVSISNTTIPGGAIKAAIADSLGTDNPLIAGLADLVISHAVPLTDDQIDKQPTFMPLSLAAYDLPDKMETQDEAALATPSIMVNGTIFAAPKLEVDWKPFQRKQVIERFKDALTGTGQVVCSSNLVRKTSVRTKIDRTTGGAATEDGLGQLFVQQAVMPWLDDAENTPVKWVFDIYSDTCQDFSGLINEASRNGLRIGKHQTPARLAIAKTQSKPEINAWCQSDGRVVYCIVLQSPAVMFEAAEMKGRDLKTLYRRYFQEVFLEELQLERFFAKQQLRGGYQALRYRGNREDYAPWVVSEPGSTFVVSIPEAQAADLEALLSLHRQKGLPVARSAGEVTWENCPFVPENGYGAIAVNPLPFDAFSEGDFKLQAVIELEMRHVD